MLLCFPPLQAINALFWKKWVLSFFIKWVFEMLFLIFIVKVAEWTQINWELSVSGGIAVLYITLQGFAINTPLRVYFLVCAVITTCLYVRYLNTAIGYLSLKLENCFLIFLKTRLFNICWGAYSRSGWFPALWLFPKEVPLMYWLQNSNRSAGILQVMLVKICNAVNVCFYK